MATCRGVTYRRWMSVIASVRCVLPDRSYRQDEITATFAEVVLGADDEARLGLLHRLHTSSTVKSRHLAMPLERYPAISGFGETNDVFIEVGTELGERAIREALDDAGLRPDELDLVMSVSVTGVAAPSLEARLVPRLGLRPDVRRLPIFGLGCVAGAAGVARVHDYLLGHPDGVAVLLAVELCSLTLQRDDTSTANLVASGLFGDGAAAVVMVGERRAERLGLPRRPRVLDSRSRFYPDTEGVMGWQIGDSGFRIVLEPTVADVVQRYLAEDATAFLAGHGLTVPEIGTWVAHPGGPKVIDAIIAALDLPPTALDVTRQCLSEAGNLSSVSVLQVLERTLDVVRPATGSNGVLMAMGPGFCAEFVLLQW
jgi:alkylresorcinol/alkylpyrone synthase